MSISVTDFNFDNIHLLGYKDDVTKHDVQLIYAERITANTYLKYDMLMFKHYGSEGMRFIKLILMFNDLNDITDIQIGDLLYFPDVVDLCNKLELIEESDYVISDFSSMAIEQKTDCGCMEQPKDKRKTKASPRLQITMERPRFDVEAGIIKY